MDGEGTQWGDGEGIVHRRGCECRQLHAELVSSEQ